MHISAITLIDNSTFYLLLAKRTNLFATAQNKMKTRLVFSLNKDWFLMRHSHGYSNTTSESNKTDDYDYR